MQGWIYPFSPHSILIPFGLADLVGFLLLERLSEFHRVLFQNISGSKIIKIIWNSLYSSREGEQWLKMRRVLRQRILKPRDVAIFSGEINQVIADLIKRIYILKSQAEDGETVTNVNELFFKYSMEGEVKSGDRWKKGHLPKIVVLIHWACPVSLRALCWALCIHTHSSHGANCARCTTATGL